MANNLISLQEAIDLTKEYRAKRNEILAAPYKDKDVLPLSETIPRAAIEAILAIPGCTALRIYYGMNGEGLVKAVLVGSNATNGDLLPSAILGDPPIVDQAQRCPPFCPTPSPLNS